MYENNRTKYSWEHGPDESKDVLEEWEKWDIYYEQYGDSEREEELW